MLTGSRDSSGRFVDYFLALKDLLTIWKSIPILTVHFI